MHLTDFALGGLFGTCIFYFVNKTFVKSKEYDDEESGTNQKNISYGKTASNYRLILGVRNDLKMQKGKVAAQCAHAAIAAYEKASERSPDALEEWINHGQAKITVKIESEEEMLALKRKAKELGILTSIIHDAGRTQVEPNSRTVIAFGPAPKIIVDELTAHLKLY